MIRPSTKGQVIQAAGVLLLALGGVFFAQEDMGIQSIGKMEFQKNCAVCHGVGGKGDGPFIDFLKQTPPDLTLLSKRYGGIYIHKHRFMSGSGMRRRSERMAQKRCPSGVIDTAKRSLSSMVPITRGPAARYMSGFSNWSFIFGLFSSSHEVSAGLQASHMLC
jgi:hypothetical protein